MRKLNWRWRVRVDFMNLVNKIIYNRKKKEEKLRGLKSKLMHLYNINPESDSSGIFWNNFRWGSCEEYSVAGTKTCYIPFKCIEYELEFALEYEFFQIKLLLWTVSWVYLKSLLLGVDRPEMGLSRSNFSAVSMKKAPKYKNPLPFTDLDSNNFLIF